MPDEPDEPDDVCLNCIRQSAILVLKHAVGHALVCGLDPDEVHDAFCEALDEMSLDEDAEQAALAAATPAGRA